MGGSFAFQIWGACIQRGLYTEGLIFGFTVCIPVTPVCKFCSLLKPKIAPDTGNQLKGTRKEVNSNKFPFKPRKGNLFEAQKVPNFVDVRHCMTTC